ncbi:MAG: electron transporter RnfB [Erysipelotrichaceae bacterium]|nr:electron transporter RnfB [Erysipelotrichaceae bacterium]
MLRAMLTMLAIGAVLGLMLAISAKIFYVKADERTEKVTSMLPGYNCGSCGYPGCSGMAAALVEKSTDTLNCRPCKPDQRQAIVDYLNTTPGPDGETLKVKSI